MIRRQGKLHYHSEVVLMTQHNTDQPPQTKARMPKLVVLAPLALVLAVGFWFFGPSFDRGDRAHSPSQSITTYDEQPPPNRDDRGRRRPPHHRGRHHGPPPGLPPTIIFLIGGGLGYLIGRRGPRCCGHHHEGPRHRGPRYDSASDPNREL